MTRVREYCVIGHGLTGTAACKYLAERGADVVLVGPSEARGAHGACYDEGRIYRILDPMECWARLAEKSIHRYEDVARRSGVEFHEESGLLIFGVEDAFVQETRSVAAKMGTRLEEFPPEGLARRFPWLRAPAETRVGLFQASQAGHLSPRKLTEAQLRLAAAAGAEYLDEVVAGISQPGDEEPFTVALADGSRVLAKNVLVAAGVYSSVLPLLPEDVAVSLTGAQAMLAELSPEDAQKLRDMPSMIYEGVHEDECFYLLPPIQYPDGAWLLKIGPSTAYSPPLRTAEELDAWFRRGRLDEKFESAALRFLRAAFPGVTFSKHRPLLCVTDCTPTQRPYVDLLRPGWGVCTGGNGWAAKSSDAIGDLAAQMMALPGHWSPDPQLPQEWFRAVTPGALAPSPELSTALARVEAFAMPAPQAAEALGALSLLARPRAAPPALAEALREALAALWGSAPTVLCSRAPPAVAPAHPFVALATGELWVVVIPSG